MADPAIGMPIAQALAICDRVTAWAVRRYAATKDPLYASTSTLTDEVRAVLASLGGEHLPRLLVERVIDQALISAFLTRLRRQRRRPGAAFPILGRSGHPGTRWYGGTSLPHGKARLAPPGRKLNGRSSRPPAAPPTMSRSPHVPRCRLGAIGARCRRAHRVRVGRPQLWFG